MTLQSSPYRFVQSSPNQEDLEDLIVGFEIEIYFNLAVNFKNLEGPAPVAGKHEGGQLECWDAQPHVWSEDPSEGTVLDLGQSARSNPHFFAGEHRVFAPLVSACLPSSARQSPAGTRSSCAATPEPRGCSFGPSGSGLYLQ
jgi:hypothetical protein